MLGDLPRFKIFIRLLHPFPEDKAKQYPNLAQSKVRLTVKQINTKKDIRDWGSSQHRQLIRNSLKQGILQNPDYFPLDSDMTDEMAFYITVWDRKKGEMTGVLFKDEDLDIPDQYLAQ
jgi:hypothetical protein